MRPLMDEGARESESQTASQTPSSLVTVKANREPSGAHCGKPRRTSSGISTSMSAPPSSGLIVIPIMPLLPWKPFVFGLIRRPARRSIGCAISTIFGIDWRWMSSIVRCVGSIVVDGSGGARRMSTIAADGCRYGSSPCACGAAASTARIITNRQSGSSNEWTCIAVSCGCAFPSAPMYRIDGRQPAISGSGGACRPRST